jgi:hypothetical protein
MKIHLGSGKRFLPDYINCDLYAKDADVRQDLRELFFDPDGADEVLCVHVLEHFTRDDAINLCAKFREWLKPGGRLVVEMPDFDKCMALCEDDRTRADGIKGLLGGRRENKQKWAGWMRKRANRIISAAKHRDPCLGMMPELWRSNGEPHLYVWSSGEFAEMLSGLGLTASIESPQWHGPRPQRDFRVVGVK